MKGTWFLDRIRAAGVVCVVAELAGAEVVPAAGEGESQSDAGRRIEAAGRNQREKMGAIYNQGFPALVSEVDEDGLCVLHPQDPYAHTTKIKTGAEADSVSHQVGALAVAQWPARFDREGGEGAEFRGVACEGGEVVEDDLTDMTPALAEQVRTAAAAAGIAGPWSLRLELTESGPVVVGAVRV